jgi:putative flippase GtrA
MNVSESERQHVNRLALASLIFQFGRFTLVGIMNTGISAGVDAFLLFTGMPALLAAAAALAAGATNGYILNRRWTFAATDSWRARMTYVVLQGSGAGLTIVLVWAMDSVALVGHFASFIAASVPVTVVLFFANRAWTFSGRGQSASPGHTASHGQNGPQRHDAI